MDTDSELADGEAEPRTAWWQHRLTLGCVAAVGAATIVSIVIRMLTPMWVILYAADDDLLYVRLGHSLIAGDWLGAYDMRTLEKPAGFSMFLAMAHLIPLPFLLVVHLFHLAVAALFAYALARITSHKILGVIVYIVLALDPSYYSNGASRVMRDNWYSSMSLLLFALAMLAIPKIPNPVVGWRGRRDIANWVVLGLASGIVLTGYWLTRVERPWLVPPIGTILVGGFMMRRRNLRLSPDLELSRWRTLALAAAPIVTSCVVALGVLAGSLSFVSWKNERAYGVAIIDDFVTGEFARMYGDWQSVEAGSERQYVSINRAQREAVYQVSPSARELKSDIESPKSVWLGFGCQATHICNDIVMGWLLFGLRDATSRVGESNSAPQAQAFWSRIADDIERACSDGQLSCRRPMPFALPDPSQVHVGRWWDSTVSDLRYMLDMKGAEPRRPLSGEPSTPDDAELWNVFRATVRGMPSSLAAQRADEKDAASWLDDLVHLRNSYRRILAVAFPLSIVGYLVAGWRRRSKWSRVFLIGLASGAAVATRAIILGLVDSTSFPAIDAPTYVLPASAFLLVFVACGMHLLVESLRPRRDSADDVGIAEEDQIAATDEMLNFTSAV